MGTVASANAEQDRRVSLTPNGWGSTGWYSQASLQEFYQCNGPMFPSSLSGGSFPVSPTELMIGDNNKTGSRQTGFVPLSISKSSM
eukprot:5522695-Ditylum_brightwellii.AAC.1